MYSCEFVKTFHKTYFVIFISHVKNRYVFVTLGSSVIVTIVREHMRTSLP